MSQEIIGRWDDLMQRADLRGHQVKVTVLDEGVAGVPDDDWVAALDRLVAGAVAAGHEVDASRDSVYTGTADDPR